MVPSRQLLYESLTRLKLFQESHQDKCVLKGSDVLGEEFTRCLVSSGYLEQVIKGWYIPSYPEHSGTSVAWFASYWSFISTYMDDRFGDNWALSPELSLSLYGGMSTIPKQIVVRSPKGTNNIIQLPFGCSILDMKASVPDNRPIHKETGARLYPVEKALFQVQPDIYRRDPNSIAICLSLLQDESTLIREAVDGDTVGRVRLGRVVGALRAVGKELMAERILKVINGMGYRVTEENPFEAYIRIPERPVSPFAARIEILWGQMREDIIHSVRINDVSTRLMTEQSVLKDMDDNYVNDSYNSLSIEGYKISAELIEKVRRGDWNPEKGDSDKKERNALVARGYYQAYQAVRQSIKKVFSGTRPGLVYATDHRDWHYQLFEPSVKAGILKPSDLVGYRNHNVYIKNSMHVPVGPHAVIDCMSVLDELMQKEPVPIVRAILGHFFFTFVHPYMDGNGRTARFVMNSQLATAGYGWLVVPENKRNEYLSALEEASIRETIKPFADFIFEQLIAQKKGVDEIVRSGRDKCKSYLDFLNKALDDKETVTGFKKKV